MRRILGIIPRLFTTALLATYIILVSKNKVIEYAMDFIKGPSKLYDVFIVFPLKLILLCVIFVAVYILIDITKDYIIDIFNEIVFIRDRKNSENNVEESDNVKILRSITGKLYLIKDNLDALSDIDKLLDNYSEKTE